MKLYVGNLPYTTTEDDLRALFSRAGAVASVAMIKDRETGRSKGFAFVEMGSQSDGEKAIQMFNGYTMNNRQLTVNQARPREERPRDGFRPQRRSFQDSGARSGSSSGSSGGGGQYRRQPRQDDED
jgi:RNA recognition motif-containing protein